MSRTDMDPATLANALRRMAGDGSVEWVIEPIQASVLLDVADALDENAKLRTQLADVTESMGRVEGRCAKLRKLAADAWCYINHPADSSWTHMRRKEARDSLSDRMRELGMEVDE